MTTQTEIGEFNLIIAEVDASRAAEASRKFAAAFGLDAQLAEQIVRSAPIIFASKLTKKEVKAITPNLKELSKEGIEFRITARLARKIPKVNWPVRPQFTAGGSTSSNGLAFEWDNNAFVCPGCGETFLFRRLGRLPLTEAPEESGPAAAPAPAKPKAAAPAPRPTAPAPGAAEPEIDLAGPDMAALDDFGLGDVAAAEEIQLPDQVEEITLADTDLGSAGAPIDLEPSLDSAAVEEGGELSEAIEEEVAGGGVEGPGGDGDRYNVFLSKISDKIRQKKAAELIAKVKNCSQKEAAELSSRLVIPLAKNVGRDQAEDILTQFKRLKIFGRMTKAK